MDTRPTPADPPEARLDDFRVVAPFEIEALLQQMVAQRALVTIATPGGASCTTTLWEVDHAKGVVRFTGDRHDPQLARVLNADDAVAVGYLDSIKVQFDVDGLVQVHAGGASALNCSFPTEIFRFQRRASFRVRPLLNSPPAASFRHPAIPEMGLELRVLDVSIGGIALLIPENVPLVDPGVLISQVTIELDAETRFVTAMRVAHVTSMMDNGSGLRLGCELERMSGDSLRALQRFIDQTQKRRRLMARDDA
ncbi:flagellar brake protein [Eleftheria terrae]|uniref:flagellar brake protein n=1 Tax=Eleftheria terrae TaxID=1597781 RepID=UPI00263AA764|nr:flagellar brake protein [Eleftheria terrae]WKB54489.1 flagellar brake protein [Eleftheria terrae]